MAAAKVVDAEEDRELTEATTVGKNTDFKSKAESKSKSNITLGKHYMVFMTQCVTPKGQPVSCMVARYCLRYNSAFLPLLDPHL